MCTLLTYILIWFADNIYIKPLIPNTLPPTFIKQHPTRKQPSRLDIYTPRHVIKFLNEEHLEFRLLILEELGSDNRALSPGWPRVIEL